MAGNRKRAASGGRVRRALRWVLLLGLFGLVAGAATVAAAYVLVDVPDPNEEFQAETTRVFYSDGEHKIGEFAVQNRTAVPLSKVPDHVQEAVVAAENRDFWTSGGIDLKAIARAAYSNLTTGTTQGASTITQQYVKILYLTQEQTYTRKAKEAILAIKVEQELSKEQILEGYLNTIYFGRGAYGIQAASKAYFGKPVSQLSVREGAVLASVLNSPGSLDPAYDKDNAEDLLARYRYVLDGMAETGAIDRAKASKAGKRLPRLDDIESSNTLGGPRGFLLKLVEHNLAEQGFTDDEIYGGGLKVVTTFDYRAQKATQRAVREVRPKGRKGLHVGISSVEPGTGALRAMYGGPDYVDSQINWAAEGGQPGSSFKPFALAAGLRSGFTPEDSYFEGNSPYDLPGPGQVGNQGGSDYGSVSLEQATTQSINTAYVDMTLEMDNGPQKVIRAAEDAGVDEDPADPLQPVGGIALGAYKVPVTEMAEGYATFAANGRQADWYVLEKVTDDDGGVRFRHQHGWDRRFSKAVASNVTASLQTVIDDPQGTGYDNVSSFGRPAAGKTGTATSTGGDVSSSWFVGYTPQLATAVMYVRGDGNDDLRGYLDPFYGGEYPARTWETMMAGALQGKPVREFPEPADLEERIESDISSPSPEPEPSYTPDPVYTPTPEEEPEPTPTPEPEPEPEPTPSEEPEPTPSEEPEPTPSDEPPPSSDEPCLPPLCDDGGGGGGDGNQGGGDAEPGRPPDDQEE